MLNPKILTKAGARVSWWAMSADGELQPQVPPVRAALRGRATFLPWQFVKCVWLIAPMAATSVRAVLPEPDTVFHGAIAHEGVFVTAQDSNVLVEVRKEELGPAVATYRMGADPSLGDKYIVRAKLESKTPLVDADASNIGDSIYLVVIKGETIIGSSVQSLSSRGSFVNVNFGDVDSDGDGMSDSFETQYFGSSTAGSPTADSDNDGRPDKREFLQGTNPLVADGRHPADLSPADDALAINEVTAYTLAWQTGAPWAIEPLVIPISYVTRANLLWKAGESYVFDNEPPTNAPNWWVSAPAQGAALSLASPTGTEESSAEGRLVLSSLSSGKGSTVSKSNEMEGSVPARYSAGVPFQIKALAQPGSEVKVYAVEDRVPEGVLVREITEGGRWDSVNRKVKWGPYFDSEPRQLAYQVIPLESATGPLVFAGVGSFDGTDIVIPGLRTVGSGISEAPRSLTIRQQRREIHLEWTGEPGQTVTIQSSQDLATWLDVDTTIADDHGVVRLVRALSDDAAAVFFRARVQTTNASRP